MKGFDAMAFKRKVQTEISDEIRHPTPAQEIAYFRQAAETGALGEWWRSVRRVKSGTSR
ncbi:MAG: hypothetical protein ACRDJE_07675 [Dehalococcoidia bacterium]